jgi:hypothetical protein
VRASGALLCLLLGCARGSPVAPPAHASAESPAQTTAVPAQAAALIALVELPRSDATAGLSGTWFEPRTRSLFALQDTVSRIVPLVASSDFRSWTVGEPIALRGRPDASWDGEAIARAGDELFVVTVESSARIERFSLDGEFRATVAVPDAFAYARDNKGLEALAASPSGRYLFFANEAALPQDGPLATRAVGTTVRIVRRDLARKPGADQERAYCSEPLVAGGSGRDGEMGVSDLAALSDHVLLVLERGYQPGFGNTVRIFRVDFAAPLQRAQGAPARLPKTLIADLGSLPARGVSHDSPQPNPLLENYEALSLGPQLPNGRWLLFLTSDDNTRSEQRPRILVLSVQLDAAVAHLGVDP